MLIEQKKTFRFRIKPLADDKGNLIRESKPFRSDGKSREYIVLELEGKEVKDEDGNIDLGVLDEIRVVKTVWENRHAKTFSAIADRIESEGGLNKDGFVIGVNLKAATYKLPCDPYYIYDKEGTQLVKADGKPMIGRHVRFVLLENENSTVEQEYERACAELDYVTADDDLDREDEKNNEPPVDDNKGGRRRR